MEVIRPWLVPGIEERRGDGSHPPVLAGADREPRPELSVHRTEEGQYVARRPL